MLPLSSNSNLIGSVKSIIAIVRSTWNIELKYIQMYGYTTVNINIYLFLIQ